MRWPFKIADKDQFDRGAQPYQDVRHLIELRNALMHYEPKDVVSPPRNQQERHKFEKALKGRFPKNPFMGRGNAFYPDKCLGHGCAAWAVGSSVDFIDQFCEKIGIEPTYRSIRAILITE
jgi:hypothetical protein